MQVQLTEEEIRRILYWASCKDCESELGTAERWTYRKLSRLLPKQEKEK